MKSNKRNNSKGKHSPSKRYKQGDVLMEKETASVKVPFQSSVVEGGGTTNDIASARMEVPNSVSSTSTSVSTPSSVEAVKAKAPKSRPSDYVEAAKLAVRPKLEVLICTRSQTRLNQIRPLPRIKGVGYLISCQVSPQQMPIMPEHLRREDIRLSVINSMGLSLNRNNAFDNAVGEICLIGDDDLEYDPAGLKKVIESFEKHPEIDFALFRHKGFARSGPDYEYNCSRRFQRNHHAVSFDIAVRKSSIIDRHKMRFNPNFGVGLYDFTAGEESLFCLEMQRKWKVKGRYFPIDVCTHCQAVTVEKASLDPKVLHAEGAYIARRWPVTGLLRIFRKAYRLNKVNPFSLARHMFYGWKKAMFKPSSLGF